MILHQKMNKRRIFQAFLPESSCFSSELNFLNLAETFNLPPCFSAYFRNLSWDKLRSPEATSLGPVPLDEESQI